MHRAQLNSGITFSYEKCGDGPSLVLIHGAFSDHRSNWEFVLPYFAERFTVYALARRGRGETDATDGHRLEDEAEDAAALVQAIGDPVFLLGHSYGAHIALSAAAIVSGRVRKMVLYEAPRPNTLGKQIMESLTAMAQVGDWESFTISFFRDVLSVPDDELSDLRATEHLWAPIIADAKSSLGDLRALSRYDFTPECFAELRMPILLQRGTESPRALYVTDSLLSVLPNVRLGELKGQAHEGMTTAPKLYAEAVTRFLLG